jgi:stage V sporulation protein S
MVIQIYGLGSAIHIIHNPYYYYDSLILFMNNLEFISHILYNESTYIIKAKVFSWEGRMDIIKVSANSRTSAVAGAIAGVIRESKHAEVQAIGAGAVNQAVKALVLAVGYLREDGIQVVCIPEFADVTIDEKVRTAIKLVIETRE